MVCIKPRVLSTLEADLAERLPVAWPVSWNSQSHVFHVNLKKLMGRWHDLNSLFGIDTSDISFHPWDARNVMCGMELPKGDTKLVVHLRRVPKRTEKKFPMLFLFSECYFVIHSALDYLRTDLDLDSLLTWPVTSLRENLFGKRDVHVRDLTRSPQYSGNEHCLNKQVAKLLEYTETETTPQEQAEELSLSSGESVLLDVGWSNEQYFLCCQGLTQSEIVDMVLTVAKDVARDDGNVALTCPREARDFMEDLLGLRSAETDPEKFFGRRLATSVEVHEEGYFIRFGMTKDTLRSLAAVIHLFRRTYGSGGKYPGMEDLFDIPYSRDEYSGETNSFMLAMKSLEKDFISRKQPGSSRTSKKHEEQDKWEEDRVKEALYEAAKAAGITAASLERGPSKRRKRQNCKMKPPMVVFIQDKPYKVMWHSKGRTVIKKEYALKFTGIGVKARRSSILMWLALLIGIVLVVGYFAYRAASSNTSFEDILQTALSIAALYAATIIPMIYYIFHNGEDLDDVLSGRIHLDKRREFELLPEDEKLHLCLRSLKERPSDRKFIDRANTCYVIGTEIGAEMRVNVHPCLGNLLMIGFRYWEDENSGRRGLLTPNGVVLELKDVHRDLDRNPTVYDPERTTEGGPTYNLLHAQRARKTRKLQTNPSDCPIEHYYVG